MSAQIDHKSDAAESAGIHQGGLVGRSVSMDSVTGRRPPWNGPPTLAMVPRAAAKSEVTELVEQHLDLVGILVAERLRDVPAHVRRDDLMSAGMMALVLSARSYDPGRGVPFNGFAAFRIRGALIDELRTMDWASRSVRSRARDVETVRALLTTTLDRPPGTDEIAGAMGISPSELDAVYADLTRGAVLSLQGFASDAVPDPPANHTTCPESLILRREQLGYLHDAIAALPVRLRFVVVAYYFEHRQMSDIAVELSVTQSRVSQMCAEATAFIRDGMNSQLDPDAVRLLVQTGRAAAVRNAYFQALADRSTLAGRLEMSTSHGEMRTAYPPDVEPAERSRIA